MKAYQESLAPSLRGLMTRFRYAGMARKVVGVRSVGIRECAVMLLGRDDGDPLLMKVKEAQHVVRTMLVQVLPSPKPASVAWPN